MTGDKIKEVAKKPPDYSGGPLFAAPIACTFQQSTRLSKASDLRLATAGSPLVPPIKRRLIPGLVSVGVLSSIVAPITVFAAIAVVAVIETAPGVRIERLALVQVFSGLGHAVLISSVVADW